MFIDKVLGFQFTASPRFEMNLSYSAHRLSSYLAILPLSKTLNLEVGTELKGGFVDNE